MRKQITAKQCRLCGLNKPLEDFHRGNAAGGRQTWCKVCRTTERLGPPCKQCGGPCHELARTGLCRSCWRVKPWGERFWAKVEKGPGCWNWTAYKVRGYGLFRLNNRPALAHRISYKLVKGPIPDGLVIDHLCRNRACVNPDHMEPVTIGENVMRGETIPAENAARTHCKRGHPFDDENTVWSRGARLCRQCLLKRKRESYHRNKASAKTEA